MTSTKPPSFSDRIKNVPESFIREILKVSSKPEVISFAGGLPNPNFFPVEKIALAAETVLRREGSAALQYWITEGYLPLRDYIAQWQSKKTGRPISAEEIIMLNGSQQGLDLIGKIFLNQDSPVLLEGPSYLGAIQAFSLYQPSFHHIKINDGGPDVDEFRTTIKKLKPVIFYCVPNFQNPTGNTYDHDHRHGLTAINESTGTIWVEDNPYAEIYFEKNNLPDFFSLRPGNTISLGSFSKIISPGMRMGWAMGPKEIIRQMSIAKQASDLHSNNLTQRIIYQFLMDNPLEDHLNSIRTFYKQQAGLMMKCMKEYFPKEVSWIIPKGGMFIWVTLPERMSASTLLQHAMLQNVLFVPGENFYVGNSHGHNTLRMNFSNPSKEELINGTRILGDLMRQLDRDSDGQVIG